MDIDSHIPTHKDDIMNPYNHNPFIKNEDDRELKNEYDANRAIADGIVSKEELDDPHGEWTQWTISYNDE